MEAVGRSCTTGNGIFNKKKKFDTYFIYTSIKFFNESMNSFDY